MEKQDFCAKHNEKKNIFCFWENEFFCPFCIIPQHKSHQFFTEEQISKEIFSLFNSESEIAMINQEKTLIEKCKKNQLLLFKFLDSELEARQEKLSEIASHTHKIHPKISDIGLQKIKDKFFNTAERDHKLIISEKAKHFSQLLQREVEKTAQENMQLIDAYISSFSTEFPTNHILHCAIGDSSQLYLLELQSTQAFKKIEIKNGKFLDQCKTVSITGKIYAVGGKDVSNPSKSCLEVDLEKDLFSYKADMRNGRQVFGISVTSREIFVLGGQNGSYYMNHCEAQDIETNTWKDLPDLPKAMFGVAAEIDKRNHTLFAFGGGYSSGSENTIQSLQLYTRKQWEQLNYTGEFEKLFGAIAFQHTGEDIWIVGGQNNNGQPLDSIQVLNKAKKSICKQEKQICLSQKSYFFWSPAPCYYKDMVFIFGSTDLMLFALSIETNQWKMKAKND